MISEQEIELYADRIAGFDWRARIDALIGHLDDGDQIAVLERAAQNMRRIGDSALAEAEALEDIDRLAKASGMPAGERPFTWLMERGLIVEVEGRARPNG
jgi:hypothetical protein